MNAPAKPIKWHGGKSYLADWIRQHYPARSRYTHSLNPHAGGLGTLFGDDPSGVSETVNDIDGRLTNFWPVLRDPDLFVEFQRQVELTPFSQVEFEAEDIGADRVSQAFAFFIQYRMSRQGLGKCYATPTRRTRRGINENVSAWLSAVDGADLIATLTNIKESFTQSD